jgi:hypothetical protein
MCFCDDVHIFWFERILDLIEYRNIKMIDYKSSTHDDAFSCYD